VIVVGLEKEEAEAIASLRGRGENTNRFGVENEESRDHPDIYLCRRLKSPWAEFGRNSGVVTGFICLCRASCASVRTIDEASF